MLQLFKTHQQKRQRYQMFLEVQYFSKKKKKKVDERRTYY